MATFEIKQGDHGIALRYDLPEWVDLTGASVRFSARGLIDRAIGAVASAAPPAVQYVWTAQNTAAPTRLLPAEFEVTFADGGVLTFPTQDEPLAVHVTERVEAPGAAIVIHYTTGDTVVEPFALADDTGAALDLTGAAVAALVTTPGGTVEHPLTIHDAPLGEAWPAWGALALPAGRYPVRLRVTWPDGGVMTVRDSFELQVTS